MAPLKVLVPLDGSEFSRGLVPHICHLLNPQNHELILLRVADEPVGVIGQPPRQMILSNVTMAEYASPKDIELAHHPIYANQQRDADRAALYGDLIPVARELTEFGYSVKSEVRFGDAVQEIAAYIREEHVDMVAIGTHGRSGLRRVALGSVTAELLSAACVPTLVVKLNMPFVIDDQVVEILN